MRCQQSRHDDEHFVWPECHFVLSVQMLSGKLDEGSIPWTNFIIAK